SYGLGVLVTQTGTASAVNAAADFATATVADPPLTATGQGTAATAGQALTAVLATFTDPDSTQPATAYTATIAWGDGTSSAATFTDADPDHDCACYTATIAWGDGTFSTVNVPRNTGNGPTPVLGSHTYAEDGSYVVQVTVYYDDVAYGPSFATATIADAPLTA